MLHICSVRRPVFYSGSFTKRPVDAASAVFKALEQGLCFLGARGSVKPRGGQTAPRYRGLGFRDDVCAPQTRGLATSATNGLILSPEPCLGPPRVIPRGGHAALERTGLLPPGWILEAVQRQFVYSDFSRSDQAHGKGTDSGGRLFAWVFTTHWVFLCALTSITAIVTHWTARRAVGCDPSH